MTEPTAALGGTSRASRMAMALIQQLFGGFPFASAAALLPLTTKRGEPQLPRIHPLITHELSTTNVASPHCLGNGTLTQFT